MNQSTIDYLHSRSIGSEFTAAGDITTTCQIRFDNGSTVTGTYVCDITAYDMENAKRSAYNDALKILAPGIEFVLNK